MCVCGDCDRRRVESWHRGKKEVVPEVVGTFACKLNKEEERWIRPRQTRESRLVVYGDGDDEYARTPSQICRQKYDESKPK